MTSKINWKRSLLAAAVAAAWMAGAHAAITPPGDWSFDTEEITGMTLNFDGGLYGAMSPAQENTHTYKISASGILEGGVYGMIDMGFGNWELIGDPASTGIAKMNRVWNEGTMRDTEMYDADGDRTPETPQVGASWRINEFYNAAGGSFDGRELRIYRHLWNDGSTNFSADDLRVEAGGIVENTGTMKFVNVYAGMNDADANSVDGAWYTVSSGDAFLNEGTIEISGNFVNYLKIKDSDHQGKWTIGHWDNNADGVMNNVTVTNGLENKAGKTLTMTMLSLAGTSSNAGILTATTAVLTGGTLTNTGSLDIGTLTGTGALSLEASGAAQIDTMNYGGTITNAANNTVVTAMTLNAGSNLTNAGRITGETFAIGGTANNNGTLTYSGAGTVTGTLTNNGTLSANGISVNGKGHLELASGSNATIGAVTLNDGDLTVHTADHGITSIAASNNAVINNNQNLSVAITSAESVTYNQTAGSLTATNGQWFTNSELNISGGKLERETLGSGNSYVISGNSPANFTDQTQVGSNWKDDQTVFTLGTLDSTSDIKLSSGGVIEAGKIALTEQTFTFDGGALTSSLDQMFEGVTEEAFNILTDAEASISTEVLGASSVEGVSADFSDNISFTENGGTIVLTDAAVTTGAVAASSAALKQLAGGNASKVNVVYTGTISTSTSSGQGFYLDTFTALKEEQQKVSDPASEFIEPGVIFAGMTYTNKDSENGTAKDAVTIGTAAEGDSYLLDQSIGFKAVADASSVTVKDGKKFVLVGGTDGETELVGTTGGAVAVKGADSVFQLGTTGVADAKGHLQTVTVADNGAFSSKAGTYRIDTLNLTAGTGAVEAGSVLTIGTVADAAGATMTNAGTLTYTNAAVFNADYANRKTMTLEAGATVNGGFSNAQGAELKSNGTLVFANGTAVTNEGTIRQTGASTTIARDFLNDENAKFGAAESDVAVSGKTFSNAGDFAAKALSIESQGGIATAEGSITYAGNMEISGTSRATVSGTVYANELDVQGTLIRGRTASIVTGQGAIERILASNADHRTRLEALGVVAGESLGRSARSNGIMLAAAAAPTYTLDSTATDEDVLGFDGEYGNTLVDVSWTDEQSTAVSASSGAAADGNYSVGLVGDTTFADKSSLTTLGTFYVDHALTMGEGTTFANDGWNDSTNGRYATGRVVVRDSLALDAGSKAVFEELWIDEAGRYETAAGGSGEVLRMKGGVYAQTGGFAGWDKADFTKGSVSVAKGALSFGMTEKDLEGLTKKEAVLALGSGTLVMNDVSIAVGDAGAAELGAGDIFFGDESALVFTTANLDGKAPLVSTDGKLTVEKGSELVLANASIGRHYLGDKIDLSGLAEGAWTGEDFVNKTGQEVTFGTDEDGVYMVVGTEDVTETDMNVAAAGIVNAVIASPDRGFDADDAGVAFISRVLDDQYAGTNSEAVKGAILNSVMMTGIASGADAYALDTVDAAASMIDARLSLANAYRAATGMPQKGGLWAQATGGKWKTDDLDAPAGMASGYDADAYGFMLGADAVLPGEWTVGLAAGYQTGDLESEGDFAKTTTDVDSWGIYAYGAKRLGSFNFTAQLGYTQFSADAEQALPGTIGMGKAEASPDSSVISAGLGAEWAIDMKPFKIVPHAGVRWLYADFDGYAVEIGGRDAFEVASDEANVFQIPVGVSASMSTKAGGWTLRPYADATVVANFGDTDRAYDISNAAVGASDSLGYDIAGDFVGKLSLGFAAETKNVTLGLKYTGAAGDAGKQNHALTGEVKWRF